MAAETVYLSKPFKAETTLPWDVTRLNRLLRPLNSKLEALEKLCAKDTSQWGFGRSESPLSSTSEDSSDERFKGSKPFAGKKMLLKRRYGGRLAKVREQLPSAVPEQPQPPSPTSPQPPTANGTCIEAPVQVEVARLPWHARGIPDQQHEHRLGVGIVTAFSNVLESTRENDDAPSRVPSLWDMAMRRVPEYIAALHAQRKTELPDSKKEETDEEVHEHLHNAHAIERCNRTVLRSLTRAHVIHGVEQAILKRQVDEARIIDFCRDLAREQDSRSSARLFSAWLTSYDSARDADLYHSRRLRTRTGGASNLAQEWSSLVMYERMRTLNDMLRDGKMTLEVLDHEKVWRSAIKWSRKSNDRLAFRTVAAGELLETMLLCAAGAEPSRTGLPSNLDLEHYSIIDKVCEALIELHVYLVCNSGESTILTGTYIRLIRAYSDPKTFRQNCQSGAATSAALIAAAEVIAGCYDEESRPRPQLITSRLHFFTLIYDHPSISRDAATAMVTAIAELAINFAARLDDRTDPGQAFELLRHICDALLMHNTQATRLVALEAAMGFASRRPHAKHTAYANVVENKVSLKKTSETRPLRWDSGLCEWAAATPAPKPKRSRFARISSNPGKVRDISSNPGSGRNTPVEETSRGTKRTASEPPSARKRLKTDTAGEEAEESEDELSLSQPTFTSIAMSRRPISRPKRAGLRVRSG